MCEGEGKVPSSEAHFEDFVDPRRWRRFEDYAKLVAGELDADVATLARENARIRQEARDLLKRDFTVSKVGADELAWAEEKLFSEAVCGIDGTQAVYPMLSGVRCQIGVAAVSYHNKRTEGVVFISEQQISAEETTILGILKRRKKSEKLVSRMLIRAIMFYMERQHALSRSEEWVLFNGPLVPYELRTGIGSFRALDPCLHICEQVITRKTAAGVIANSSDYELLSLGLALEPGEYVRLKSLKVDLDEYLEESGLRGNDRKRMAQFNEQFATQVDVGLYRAGGKAYIFHAHTDCFDDAARIVMRDSMFQPLRSYPLLIDYADALCARMLSSADFKRMVDVKLAKVGNLEFEQSEGELRRR